MQFGGQIEDSALMVKFLLRWQEVVEPCQCPVMIEWGAAGVQQWVRQICPNTSLHGRCIHRHADAAPLLHPTFFCLLSEISHHQGAIAKASWGLETISRCKAYKVLAAAKNHFGVVMWPKAAYCPTLQLGGISAQWVVWLPNWYNCIHASCRARLLSEWLGCSLNQGSHHFLPSSRIKVGSMSARSNHMLIPVKIMLQTFDYCTTKICAFLGFDICAEGVTGNSCLW